MTPPPPPPPDVRVVRGTPDEQELAALVAGLAAGTPAQARPSDAAHDVEPAARARRRWRDAAWHLADPLTPGPDAWRWSAHHR